jgi:hypothetical protein
MGIPTTAYVFVSAQLEMPAVRQPRVSQLQEMQQCSEMKTQFTYFKILLQREPINWDNSE